MVKEISDKFAELTYWRNKNQRREEFYFLNHVKKEKAGELLSAHDVSTLNPFSPGYRSLTYNLMDSTVVQEITPGLIFKGKIGFKIAGKNQEEAINFIKEAYKDYDPVE